MAAIARCPGRACLAGEDLDWMGGQSVQVSIDLRTQVRASLRRADRSAMPLDRRVAVRTGDAYDCRYPLAALARVERDAGPLEGEIEVVSDVPGGSGLASSAAVLLAVIASARAAVGHAGVPDLTAAMAYEVESSLTGGRVGPMDPVACSLGGLVCMSFEGGVGQVTDRYRYALDACLIVAMSGRVHDTGASIGRKQERWSRREAGIRRYREAAHAAATAMREELAAVRPRMEEVGALMVHCHHALSENLGVSSDSMDAMVARALDAGAYGAKLCGSGEGGCVLALVPGARLGTVEAALAAVGAPTRRVRPTSVGLAVAPL